MKTEFTVHLIHNTSTITNLNRLQTTLHTMHPCIEATRAVDAFAHRRMHFWQTCDCHVDMALITLTKFTLAVNQYSRLLNYL